MKIGDAAHISELSNLARGEVQSLSNVTSPVDPQAAQKKVKDTLAQKGAEIFDNVFAAAQSSLDGSVNAVKHAIGNADKDLQSQDKLGNTQIQTLMSNYNEAQTLASSVLKKKDGTSNAVIQKI